MTTTEAPTSSSPDVRALLRELRDTARDAARATAPERAPLLARRRTLRREIASIPSSEENAVAVLEHLAHMDSRIERLENHPETALRPGLEILELRGDMGWLTLCLTDDALGETLFVMEREAEAVRPSAAELQAEDGGRAMRAAEAVIRAVEETRRVRVGAAAQDLGESELSGMWSAYLEARELRMRTGLADDTCRELTERITACAASLPPHEAAEGLARFAAEYEDISLDLLALQADAEPATAAQTLDQGRREMVWLRDLVRDTKRRALGAERDRAALKALRRATRRLRSADRRLKREAQEVRLQARLEGIFGRRPVAIFENVILWLIVLVLVVLIVEACLPEAWPKEDAPPEVHAEAAKWRPWLHALAWIDAGICLVFLIEFFGKLALVRGRLSWFWRHFLVDLVPSIPYGLVASQALDALRAGRIARFARLTRVLRYVRVARPVVRFLRFFGFLQRGLDRLVRLHGNLLNRNILFFEPATEVDASPLIALRERIRESRVRARRTWRRMAPHLPSPLRAERLAHFISGFPDEEALALAPGNVVGIAAGSRHLRAEELIQTLTQLDGGTVEAELGAAGAERIATTLDRLDAPFLRRLPILRQLLPPARKGDGPERVAAAAKALGRFVERRLETVNWVSDLSGVVTGPQFLDRLASAMVKATARPAKRLLMFGIAFLLLKGFVHLFVSMPEPPATAPVAAEAREDPAAAAPAEEWKPPLIVRIADWLGRTLGTPFLVLGTVALSILLLGSWFKQIAGEATDFYNRTAEAQYINLLKSAKLAHLEEDLKILWDRVLRPESLLRGEEAEDGPGSLRRRFELPGGTLERSDRLLQLYRDYLDGALFHVSDTKTSSQLLGNLALEQIRAERLGTSRRERKRLGDLDLDRERKAIRGPYLWFRSLTHSVTQWSAKLILEYNRHAIPLKDREDYPPHVAKAMESWLDKKLTGRPGPPEEEEQQELPPGFLTTEFSALHFLTAEEDRDRLVAERYGERTLRALQEDRRTMIRTVFGTYPFHRMTRADRTLNPFQLYTRYLAGGRVLLLPLYVLRGAIFLVRWFARRVRATVKEILDPSRIGETRQENWAAYDVAVRKINRMRKPLYMECTHFRALFDPEYLGLDLHPGEDSGLEGRTYREDLDGIGARDEEWDEFQGIRDARDSRLVDLERRAAKAGGQEAFVAMLGGGRADVPFKEMWRALSVAFAINYRNVHSLATLRAEVEEGFRSAVEHRGRTGSVHLLEQLVRLLLPSRQLRTALGEYFTRFGPADLGAKERRWVMRAARSDPEGLGRLVKLGASLEPGQTPEGAANAILENVVRHPENWSEQLVILRTVQSLSVLDVRNYRRQVRALGGYGNG